MIIVESFSFQIQKVFNIAPFNIISTVSFYLEAFKMFFQSLVSFGFPVKDMAGYGFLVFFLLGGHLMLNLLVDILH